MKMTKIIILISQTAIFALMKNAFFINILEFNKCLLIVLNFEKILVKLCKS